jgi:PAS domain S-box-containing protein
VIVACGGLFRERLVDVSEPPGERYLHPVEWQATPYAVAAALAGVLAAALGLSVWQRRPMPGATEFALLALAVADWCIANAVEFARTDLAGKIFWTKVEYIGVVSTPPLWLLCMLACTGHQRWARSRVIGLGVVPLITLMLAFTNEWHGLIWRHVDLTTEGGISMWTATYGPWFWVHTAYSYVLLSAATLSILGLARRSSQVFRGQGSLLLVGMVLPWFANAVYLAGLSPLPHLDLTPFGFALGGFAVGGSLARFHLFDVVPFAREALVQSLPDAVFVLNMREEMVDLNPAAERLLGQSARSVLGRSAAEALRGQMALFAGSDEISEWELESPSIGGSARRHFDVRRSALVDRRRRPIGWLIVARDVTDRKQMEQERLERVRVQTAQIAANAARERSDYLAEATRRLSQSLDLRATATALAELAVPRLADWCAVDVLEGGHVQRLAVSPGHQARGASSELTDSMPRVPDWLRSALELGTIQVPVEVGAQQVVEGAGDPLQVERLLRVGVGGGHVLPLVAHDRVLGALTLLLGHDGSAGFDGSLEVELASRAALAMDNARLFAEAHRAIHARDEFLSIAAHELKTPLTALSGYIQLLIRDVEVGAPPSALQRGLNAINQQSGRLVRLTAQLLDVARLETGKFVLDLREVDLSEVVRSVVQAAQAGTNRHTLVLDAPSPILAWVDGLRMEQVISNLLQNAVKFSPGGGHIDVEVSSADLDSVRVAVRDHGIGIEPVQRERIFERFYQAAGGGSRGGLGLGLYVSRQIVEQHSGRIAVEAPPDGGTRFIITLPRTPRG